MNLRKRLFKKLHLKLTVAVLAATACACLPEAEVEEVWSEVRTPPILKKVLSLDSRQLAIIFSKMVKVRSVNIDEDLGEIDTTEYEDCGQLLSFEQEMEAGELYIIELEVEDEHGNSLTAIVPVRGKNDRMPTLLINEIRTDASKPKYEYIEFKTFSAGNLGGIAVFNDTGGLEVPLFIFPPCEVEAGEYIVLHLRTIDEGWVQETKSILESQGGESLDWARDFWIEGSVKRTRKNDFIILMDQDEQILDAIVMADYDASEWKNKKIKEATLIMAEQGAWLAVDGPIGPSDAVFTSASTATRTVNRCEDEEDSNSAENWYICKSSGASPGKPNTTVRYE